MVECSKCKSRFKADVLMETQLNIPSEKLTEDNINKAINENKLICEKCRSNLQSVQHFNLMFETNIGPVIDKKSTSYLRPETAQLIFTNFKLVMDNARKKLPFGIAQLGKAFRNEISPRDFLFRTREFEQFEIEYFTDPKKINECSGIKEVLNLDINVLDADAQDKKKNHYKTTIKKLIEKKIANTWHLYWLALFYKWFLDLGIKKENLRLREHLKNELAHYATACFDIEYQFPFGWKEIHGNADRKDFDLKQHMRKSGKDLSVYIEETKEKIIPYVASEPSHGIERAFLAFMFDAYHDDKKRGNVVLKLHPKLAPVKVGVFPLVSNKDEIVKKTREVFNKLKNDFNCQYDSGGSIGRRYARADETGIVTCITVDFDSLKDNSVTLRSRDSTQQIRVKIKDTKEIVSRFLNGEKLEKLGKIMK